MLNKLRAERTLRDLKQKDVAEYLGISSTSYSYKERGKQEFTLTEIKKLLKLFDKKFEELF